MGAIFEQPKWVAKDRPRRMRDWTENSTVYVTSWGDHVHLYPDCAGLKAYGSDGEVVRARLREPICAVRTGCAKCFGEFFGEGSLKDLERLIDSIHGYVDQDQPQRHVIAAKARLRFGAGTKPPPPPADAPRLIVSNPGRSR